jgi:Domain of unknown function (DUF4340)
MKSRFGSLLLLLSVFVGLTAVYWFSFKDKTPPLTDQPLPTRESIVLVSVEAAEAQEISWSYQTTKGKISRISDTDWKLVEPSIVADGAQLADYARTALDIRGENRYPFSQVSRQDAGLDSPSLVITIVAKDNKTEKILIGKETIDKEYYYVSKEGSDFSTLVSSFSVDSIKRDPYSMTPIPSPSGNI